MHPSILDVRINIIVLSRQLYDRFILSTPHKVRPFTIKRKGGKYKFFGIRLFVNVDKDMQIKRGVRCKI